MSDILVQCPADAMIAAVSGHSVSKSVSEQASKYTTNGRQRRLSWVFYAANKSTNLLPTVNQTSSRLQTPRDVLHVQKAFVVERSILLPSP